MSRSPMVVQLFSCVAILLFSISPTHAAQTPPDNDQTLRAMRDEMARSKTRLELNIPGSQQPVRPYYIEYRLLDLDVREISAEFGTLLSTTHGRNRFMNVEARVGNYKLDSSNFIGDEGFRGFIGSQGSVGIDRDYNSLRQDLWIATDQAFKEAVETYSRKEAYLSSLARQSITKIARKDSRSSRLSPWLLRTGAIATGSRKRGIPRLRCASSRTSTNRALPITSSTPPNIF